jgi:hypothetical protein
MTTDAASLLRALRPSEDFAPDEAALERILTAPPLPPRGRRRRRRVLALAGAAGLAAAAAVALAPSGSPDVVARAAAALNDPDTILHLKSVDAHGNTMETWQADGGREERWLYRGGTDKAVESMDDWDTKTALSYSAQNDELITHTEPDWFDEKHHPIRGLGDGSPTNHVVDDLAALLDRARAGEGNAHLIGETTVRGIPVYELRVDFDLEVVVFPANGTVKDPTGLPRQTLHLYRTIYIDRDHYLPVRIVEHWPAPIARPGTIDSVTDYVTAERLPRTPDTEQLLRMSPHPGAKKVTEGRL